MCDFWLPSGNGVKRQRVYNPHFTSEVINPAFQQPPLPSFACQEAQLQTLIAENSLLKEKLDKLQKKLASYASEKKFAKGKPFISLSPDRKRHRKQEVRNFLLSVSKRLPQDWILEEVLYIVWS